MALLGEHYLSGLFSLAVRNYVMTCIVCSQYLFSEKLDRILLLLKNRLGF